MTDFEALQKMARGNMDIKMSPHFVGARTAKGGGHITMGVDADTVTQLVLNPDKYAVALYVINKEQFDQVKKEG